MILVVQEVQVQLEVLELQEAQDPQVILVVQEVPVQLEALEALVVLVAQEEQGLLVVLVLQVLIVYLRLHCNCEREDNLL